MTGKIADEVVRISGLADEVIMVDRVELRDGAKLASIGKIMQLAREVRRREIDLIVDLHSLPETNILAYLSKATYRLLANRESRSLDRLSNFHPAPPKEDKSKHLTERYADVLRSLGIDNVAREFRFTAPQEDVAFVEKVFSGSAPTVGLFPGAGHPSRCWSIENFAALAAKIEADGHSPMVILGPEETHMRDSVSRLFPTSTKIVEGLLISQFIAVAAHLSAFVTNDTGPMHLAACAGSPVLLLMDEQAPTTYLPLTGELEVIRNSSIVDIDVEDAFAGLVRLVAEARA